MHVIWASGDRGLRVTDVLRADGYDVRSLQAGTSAWASGVHPVVVGPHPVS